MEALAIADADVSGYGREDDSSAQHMVGDTAKQSSDTDQDNRFQKAVAAWRGVGLAALIAQLDSTATDIVTHQKDALLERKDVAQKTKDFRKLDDAGKLSEYKSLLKSYQTFVDLLTTHGKESSAAFLQLYTALADVPDPFPLLEASIEALVVSEDTLPKLTTENAELQKRVVSLTNQLDAAEQNLQSERKLRQDAEQGWDGKVEQVESSWRKVLEEKEGNWSAKETALNEKLENQERLLKEVKANYEVSRRLGEDDIDTAAAEKAASAELRLVASDLERTSARLAESQARNEQLRIDLARISSQSSQSANDDSAQLLRLQNENSSLLRRMETTRFERDAEKRDTEAKLRQVDRQRASANDQIRDLQKKLQQFSDYDEIKRELNMLRTIELAEADDQDDVIDVPANGSIDSNRPQKESLEQLLLARNKKLTDDLTVLRVSHQDLTQQLDQLREELSQTNAELEKSQKLSSTLENDLLQLQEEAANGLPSSDMSIAGTYTSRHPHGSSRRGRSSPTSSIISGFDGHGRSSVASLTSADTYGGGSGILPMVQAQRDRFKQKIQKLEEELQKTYATVTSLRQEVASLQKDNLNLYEKTRYVSAYNRAGASSSTMGDQPRHTSMYAADDADTGRWKTQYEANISPFAAFRGREAARAYKRMNVPERMIFSLTRLVLATRTSRNLFAGYCLALHILVFMMLYWMSAATTSVNPIDKQATSAAIAAAAAGLKDGGAGAAHGANWRQEDFG